MCGDRVLLIHRGMHKALAPGMWSCVGGHIEPEEISDPTVACYREIEEEAGIVRADIESLRLRYITVRQDEDEIRTGYYFFGSMARECTLPVCGEGTLHWVDVDAMRALPMSFSNGQIVRHWLEHREDAGIVLIAVHADNAHAALVTL